MSKPSLSFRRPVRAALRTALRGSSLVVMALLVLVPALLAGPTRVSAQGDPGRYQVAIDRALGEFESGHYEEARAFFRQAHREIPNPRTLRGIAMASYELRDYAEAYRAVRDALAFGPSDRDLTPEHRTAAMQLMDRARSLLGIMSGFPIGASVRLDGADARLEPDGSLLMGLGSHTVEVSVSDGRRASQHVDVAGGEQLAFSGDLGPEPVAQATERPPIMSVIEPQQQQPPIAQPPPRAVEEPSDLPRFRLHLFGMGVFGSYESAGASYGAAGGGGGVAGLLQLAEIYALGVQIAGSYASLFEANTRSDSGGWGQVDVLLWNELRFGVLGLGVGLGAVIGFREQSSFDGGYRTVQTRTDAAFGLVADARVYFADGLLFVAAEGRFAFGDYSGLAGVLAFGVEPLR